MADTVSMNAPVGPAVAYPRAVRIIHWTTAALLVVVFSIGLSMTRWVADDEKLRVYSWHEWAGLTVFALTAIRVWRRSRSAAPPIALPPLERAVRATVHALLYVVLLVQPIIGWLMTSAFGFDIIYLGVVPLPRLVDAPNRALAERLQGIHEALAFTLLALFALHLAAIVNHHLIRRDGVMRRMLL